jgi:hypothetical protein
MTMKTQDEIDAELMAQRDADVAELKRLWPKPKPRIVAVTDGGKVVGSAEVRVSELSRFLREECGCEPWSNGAKRGCEFPPLADARAAWERKAGVK